LVCGANRRPKPLHNVYNSITREQLEIDKKRLENTNGKLKSGYQLQGDNILNPRCHQAAETTSGQVFNCDNQEAYVRDWRKNKINIEVKEVEKSGLLCNLY
jgi:hypothetical protein